MRKLIVLLLAMASALSLRAAVPDDAQRVIKACGKPRQDRVSLGTDGTYVRDMVYRDARIYLKGKPGGLWTISSGYVNELNSMTTASGVAQVMPCLKNIVVPDAKPSSVDSNPSPQATNSESSAPIGAMVMVGFIGGCVLLYQYGKSRAWKNRPMRLCTNCYTTAQPLQHKNKRWYCGHCGADNPAPLDSPLAQAFQAKQQNTKPQLPR